MPNPHASDALPSARRQKLAASNNDAAEVLVVQRAALHRFLALRLGSAAEADDLLRNSLLRALQGCDRLRRQERVVPWFQRILGNAVTDHLRERQKKRLRAERRLIELASQPVLERDADWTTALGTCVEGLLPLVKPRYAELIRRIDLNGELRLIVARDLKMSRGAFDVALHRARHALRGRLEVFCGAWSRESCLAWTRSVAKKPSENR